MCIIGDLFLITLLTILVIDISGIINSIKTGLGKLYGVPAHRINLPLISCSFCMNFHLSWIYLLIIGLFSLLYLVVSLLFSTFIPVFLNLIINIREFLLRIIDYVE